MLIKFRKLASVFLLFMVVSLAGSCSGLNLESFTEDVVRNFRSSALAAEVKYLGEPEAGKANPFPASFVITGKVLILDQSLDYNIPVKNYKKYFFNDYIWFTDNPEEIRYIVLVEPDSGIDIIYTIVDLSYDEKVYKGIADSYMELAEILKKLTM